MKTKLLLLLVAVLTILSCDSNSVHERNSLLTSSIWGGEAQHGAKPFDVETYEFLPNGNYRMTWMDKKRSIDIIDNGKWNWTAAGEIKLTMLSISVNGQTESYSNPRTTYMRIVELNDELLRVHSRHELDSWDSGFVSELTYYAN